MSEPETVEIFVRWQDSNPHDALLKKGIVMQECGPDKYTYMKNGKHVNVVFFMEIILMKEYESYLNKFSDNPCKTNSYRMQKDGVEYCTVTPKNMYRWNIMIDGKQLSVLPQYRTILYTIFNKDRRKTQEDKPAAKRSKVEEKTSAKKYKSESSSEDDDASDKEVPPALMQEIIAAFKNAEDAFGAVRVKLESELQKKRKLVDNNHN